MTLIRICTEGRLLDDHPNSNLNPKVASEGLAAGAMLAMIAGTIQPGPVYRSAYGTGTASDLN